MRPPQAPTSLHLRLAIGKLGQDIVEELRLVVPANLARRAAVSAHTPSHSHQNLPILSLGQGEWVEAIPSP